MSPNQKYALITGATSGIGYELAKLFAKDGYNLVIISRHLENLERIASELTEQYKIAVIPIAKDLFKRDAPFEVYQEVHSKGIEINVLVNDAGQGQYGEFVDTDIDRELEIIQLNICAYVVFTKLFLRDMVERGEGKILNVSSVGGEMPGPLQAVYTATKAFVTMFTEAVRTECKDKNITITVLLPGFTNTDFFHKADMEETLMVKKGPLQDPAAVAKDGYEALMSGDDKIISGLMNKAMVALGNLLPDSTAAKMMGKTIEPSHGK